MWQFGIKNDNARENKGKVKIGSLDQNLIREDTGVPIDSANKESSRCSRF